MPNSLPIKTATPAANTSTVVAGVDVGGAKKGYHAVALCGGRNLDLYSSASASSIVAWCQEVGAQVIGIDAPCRWSVTGRSRPAERALMAKKVWCFSTPTRERAENHPKKNFHWMLAGAELFARLEVTHRLFDGSAVATTERVCFETFPQAVACALAGKVVSAKQKRTIRRELLRQTGLDTSRFTNIDLIDAALCAVTAHRFVLGAIEWVGDAESGVIAVPSADGTGSKLVGDGEFEAGCETGTAPSVPT